MGDLYDLKHGLELRDVGATASLAHADQVVPNWVDCAFSILETFARDRIQFSSDDFRAFAAGILPEPPHHNSYGALFIKASKSGIIRANGYVKARRLSAHARVIMLWSFVA